MKMKIVNGSTDKITWDNVKYPCLIQRGSLTVFAMSKTEGFTLDAKEPCFDESRETWEEAGYEICQSPTTITFTNGSKN
jgi:hypothetical protein